MGTRVWLNEVCERDQVDLTASLFSKSTARVIVSVGREDDVKFIGKCEAKGIPVLTIGVTDASGQLENEDLATWKIEELKNSHRATFSELFG
jgi:phosphoribosylformylglycinamidine synthase